MSIKPLRLVMVIGMIISLVAFVIILYALCVFIFTDRAIAGWASTIISTVFFSGIQLLVLGILGEYMGKLFIENKRRPTYIISETNMVKERDIEPAQTTIKTERRVVMT